MQDRLALILTQYFKVCGVPVKDALRKLRSFFCVHFENSSVAGVQKVHSEATASFRGNTYKAYFSAYTSLLTLKNVQSNRWNYAANI